MRHGPPDAEENFQRFRDDGGIRDRDNMSRGADDRRRTPDAFERKDDRLPPPRKDTLRDKDDFRRDYRPMPPREDRLRDRDDIKRRDDVDSGFRRGIGVDDLRTLGVGPTAGRDRDDEFRRRDDGGQRMVRGSDFSMRGEDGPPSKDNWDRDNFRPSQSNFRMQGNEKHDDTRYLTIYSFLFLKYYVKFDGDSQEVAQNNRKPSNTSVY